jgi:group I intron endonuclease
MIIYKTTNLINGKIYVGKQVNIRKKDVYLGSGKILKSAIEKYGRENFKKEILQECLTKEDLNHQEIFWIKELNSLQPIGYNIVFGGEGGDTFTNNPNQEEYRKQKSEWSQKMWKDDEYRKHMSDIRTGQKMSDQARRNMSNASIDKPKTEEHKESLSKAWEKRKIEKPHTQETRDLMSNSMIGKNVGKYIKIYEFKGPDGKIYRTDEGLVKFAKSIHKHPLSFRNLIQGKIKEYKGWTYIQTIKE